MVGAKDKMRNLRSQNQIISSWGCTNKTPLVSICCLSYNHEEFIEDAFEGFLNQKTNFPFEVIVHDDASTDETVRIIMEYQQKYPQIIRPIFQKQNRFSEGLYFYQEIYSACQGEYIAFCEGDDYWIDPLKMQKQIDFLKERNEFSACCHNFFIRKGDVFENSPKYEFSTMDFYEYAKNLPNIQTATAIFRKKSLDGFIPRGYEKIVKGSHFWFLRLANAGKLGFLHDYMSVYRIHDGGIWSGKSLLKKCKMSLENLDAMMMFFQKDKKLVSLIMQVYLKRKIEFCQDFLVHLDFGSFKKIWKYGDLDGKKISIYKFLANFFPFIFSKISDKLMQLKL